jgi:peptidoglycan/LPS O-acetylase OafA/YrhL
VATRERFTALDGVRAVAVVAVMLYHSEIGWLAASGFLGVDVFFVVSGFLISGQLMASLEQLGPRASRAELARAWIEFLRRRARRLMPTLFVLCAVLLAVCPVLAPATVDRLLADVPAALLAWSNIWQLISQQSYFEAMEREALLQHLWSLAIEWHFYLIWPIALAIVMRWRGRKAVTWVAAGGALLSTGWMALLSVLHGYPDEADPSRVYLATDTHAMGLFVGALLASLWMDRGTAAAPVAVDVRKGSRKARSARKAGRRSMTLSHALPRWPAFVAFLALGGVVACFGMGHEGQALLYRGGFLGVSLLTAVLLWALVIAPSPVSRLLSSALPVWCGTRSYSLYVWHWPVFLLLRPGHELPDQPLLALLIRIAITSAIAEASWRWVEMPLRHRPLLQSLRSRQGMALAACLLAALVLVPLKQPVTVAPEPVPEPVVTGVHGEVLTAIGDSVLLGARDHLLQNYRGIQVDAAVGRQGSQGLERLRTLRERGELAPMVALHLGTNGYLTERHMREILSDLEDRRRVLVFNVHAQRKWTQANNELLARLSGGFPNVTLINWDGISRAHPEYFVQDGIHLTGRGIQALAELIRTVVPLVPVERPAPATRTASRSNHPADRGASAGGHQRGGAALPAAEAPSVEPRAEAIGLERGAEGGSPVVVNPGVQGGTVEKGEP